eukprot:Rhum_TRINITY_DN14942_c1_g1::Rhum_TRINITY_DN14942_c1_g1_i1::g.126702::m.126702
MAGASGLLLHRQLLPARRTPEGRRVVPLVQQEGDGGRRHLRLAARRAERVPSDPRGVPARAARRGEAVRHLSHPQGVALPGELHGAAARRGRLRAGGRPPAPDPPVRHRPAGRKVLAQSEARRVLRDCRCHAAQGAEKRFLPASQRVERLVQRPRKRNEDGTHVGGAGSRGKRGKIWEKEGGEGKGGKRRVGSMGQRVSPFPSLSPPPPPCLALPFFSVPFSPPSSLLAPLPPSTRNVSFPSLLGGGGEKRMLSIGSQHIYSPLKAPPPLPDIEQNRTQRRSLKASLHLPLAVAVCTPDPPLSAHARAWITPPLRSVFFATPSYRWQPPLPIPLSRTH